MYPYVRDMEHHMSLGPGLFRASGKENLGWLCRNASSRYAAGLSAYLHQPHAIKAQHKHMLSRWMVCTVHKMVLAYSKHEKQAQGSRLTWPSCPLAFLPQVYNLPSTETAALWKPPAHTLTICMPEPHDVSHCVRVCM